VDKLIEAKIKDWNDFKQKGIEISKVTEELASRFLAGKSATDDIII
jgi:hypothetical protein